MKSRYVLLAAVTLLVLGCGWASTNNRFYDARGRLLFKSRAQKDLLRCEDPKYSLNTTNLSSKYKNGVWCSRYCCDYITYLCNRMTVCSGDEKCEYDAVIRYLYYSEGSERNRRICEKYPLDIFLEREEERCRIERETCDNSSVGDKGCIAKSKQKFIKIDNEKYRHKRYISYSYCEDNKGTILYCVPNACDGYSQIKTPKKEKLHES